MTIRRVTLAGLFAIGVALIVAPLSMSMLSRSSNGEQMVNGFRPIMQPANVKTTADYYDNVFTKLRPIALMMNTQTLAKFDAYLAGIKGMQTDATKLVPTLAATLHMSQAQVQQFLAKQFPSMAQLLKALPQMSRDFGGLLAIMNKNVPVFARVPAGLDHYLPLVRTMQANVANYSSVDAMPRMSLFPWFFIAPGILIALGAGSLLIGDWRPQLVKNVSLRHPLAH